MPSPALILRIPQPCPESWDAMPLTPTGRYCAACQKTVVDFTQKTDAEILAYFQQAAGERACGRFRARQVGRALRPALPAARPPHWQFWLAGLLAAALTVQSCQPTTGEVRPAASQHLPPPPPPLGLPTIDSTMIGDIQTLAADSVPVSAAPRLPGELDNSVLEAPEAY